MTPLADVIERLVDAGARRRVAGAALRGLATTDFAALLHLARAGEMSPGALARALALSSSGTSAAIRRLQAAGLIERDPGPGNHRDVRLRITASGAELAAPDKERLDADVEALLTAVTPATRDAVERVLARLADLLERDADAAEARARDAGTAAQEIPTPVRWG